VVVGSSRRKAHGQHKALTVASIYQNENKILVRIYITGIYITG
jgi:hypothetical protein